MASDPANKNGRLACRTDINANKNGRLACRTSINANKNGRLACRTSINLILFRVYLFLALYDRIAELLLCTETGEAGGGGEASGFDIALVVIAEDDAALADLVADVEDLIGMIWEDGDEEHGCGPTTDGVTGWIRGEVGR